MFLQDIRIDHDKDTEEGEIQRMKEHMMEKISHFFVHNKQKLVWEIQKQFLPIRSIH